MKKNILLLLLLLNFIGTICNISNAAPVANWEMDELYGGDANNEVVDSSGNNFSGTTIGSSSDQTGTTSTDQGICGYGKFNGQQQKIIVPYNQALNPDSFTVSLWAKVEGGNGTWRSPITSRYENSGASIRNGFNLYAGTNNRWQFWTGIGAAGWDVLTGPTVSLNTWTHVAISFTKKSVKNSRPYGLKQFYINGQLVAQKEAYYQPNRSDPLIIGGGGISGNTYFFNGSLSKVQLYNSPLSSQEIQSLAQPVIASCPNYTQDTVASNFNCVENGTNGITGKLYTKTTTQSFSFDIVALKDVSNIETNFANGADHTITVDLVDSNTGDGSCANFSVLSPPVSQSLLFTSSDSGTKTSASFSSDTAYQAVKCRITDNTDSPSVIGCSIDSFAIRPSSFTITSNLTNTGSTGVPKAKAGENFTLTATAAKGYTGSPSINQSKIEPHSGSIAVGSIFGSFNVASFATGSATNTTFTYSEVGLLRFAAEGIYDDSFTAIDQSGDCTNDFSNTPIAGKVGCKFGNTTTSDYFGRFTPDHFDITLNTPVFTPSCGSFTYLDQPIKYAVNPIATVLAKNTSGATTQNYTGSYWKIDSSGFTPSYTEASNTLTILESSAPVKTDNGDGTGLLTFANTTSDILAITKNTLSAPFDAEIALSFNLADTDAIAVANVDGVAQLNPVTFGAASTGNGISFSANNKSHRWGRVNLDNVHGSELTPLSVPLYTEYYNGSSFIKNTADNCTTFTFANDFSISDASDFDCSFTTQSTPVAIGSGNVKATLINSTVNNGETELTLSDNIVVTNGSGAGNTGHVDITTRFTNLPWLLYDWDGNSTHDNCPSARATFGIYKGNEKQIYFREVY